MSIVSKNALTFLVNPLKLTPMNRPPKPRQDAKHQQNRQGYQNKQNIHYFSIDNLKEFKTTHKELKAMPKPASQAGNQPTTAKGTHTAL